MEANGSWSPGTEININHIGNEFSFNLKIGPKPQQHGTQLDLKHRAVGSQRGGSGGGHNQDLDRERHSGGNDNYYLHGSEVSHSNYYLHGSGSEQFSEPCTYAYQDSRPGTPVRSPIGTPISKPPRPPPSSARSDRSTTLKTPVDDDLLTPRLKWPDRLPTNAKSTSSKVPEASEELKLEREEGLLGTKTKLRAYQNRIATEAVTASSIVWLATGAGKTLIASAVLRELIKKVRIEERQKGVAAEKCTIAVFLVPTRILVKQQSEYLTEETGLKIGMCVGQKAVSAVNYDVLVATPDAFTALVKTDASKPLERFKIVVYDEVHHVIGNHPYRRIATQFEALAVPPYVLGLTASLSYDLKSEKVRKAVENLCKALRIEGHRILNANEEELKKDGYEVTQPVVEGPCTPESAGLPMLGPIYARGIDPIPIKSATAEPIRDLFVCLLQRLSPPLHELVLCLYDAIRAYESEAVLHDSTYQSPITHSLQVAGSGTLVPAVQWGKDVHKKVVDANCSPEAQHVFFKLENCYEALRIISNSRQQELELAMRFLCMIEALSDEAGPGKVYDPEMERLDLLWEKKYMFSEAFSRFMKLRRELAVQWEKHKEEGGMKCIVFVQLKVAAHVVAEFINRDPELSRTFKASPLYSPGPATPSLSINPTQSKAFLAGFREGKFNVLVTTSVAEEGIDVQEANCVIRFDPVQNPVSLVQSRGRARKADSTFLVMKEDPDKPVQVFMQAEANQKGAVDALSRCSTPQSSLYTGPDIPMRLTTSPQLIVNNSIDDIWPSNKP